MASDNGVALLTEGVDRNAALLYSTREASTVALLTEGVDRNFPISFSVTFSQVALLTEGVDRNPQVAAVPTTAAVSPSSRRAWIEMISEDIWRPT